MHRKACLLTAAILLTSFLTPAQQPPQKSDYAHITNFFRVNDKVCTGGQPAMEDLAKMKQEGVKAIINLRIEGEAGFDAVQEAAKAKETGLRYVWIPFNGREPKDEPVAEFLKATSEKDIFPVFIHCTTNNRVSALWMIRRVLVDKWSVDDAEAEARKIGLRSQNLAEFARDYIKRRQSEPPPAAGTENKKPSW